MLRLTMRFFPAPVFMATTFSPYGMDSDDWPPLWAALLRPNYQVAEKLLSEGAELDSLIEENGDTFLHRAAQEGDLDMVQFFLKHGCPLSLEQFDYLEHTPLIRACKKGHFEVAEYLLSKGANPNACNEARIGSTALIEAVRGGHLPIVKLLLEAGANPFAQGWMQLTAYDHCERLIGHSPNLSPPRKVKDLLDAFRSRAR
jgi:ankyrin repeat protein